MIFIVQHSTRILLLWTAKNTNYCINENCNLSTFGKGSGEKMDLQQLSRRNFGFFVFEVYHILGCTSYYSCQSLLLKFKSNSAGEMELKATQIYCVANLDNVLEMFLLRLLVPILIADLWGNKSVVVCWLGVSPVLSGVSVINKLHFSHF